MDLEQLSLADLAAGICLRAARQASAHADLLAWIAAFDRREGWAGPGMLSCAHWLSWQVGLSPGAAREQVRVARRLEDLPALAEAFAHGRVSYSKVRAISRVAEPDDGVDWVELARHSSAAQLEKLARGVARARAYEAAQDHSPSDAETAAWRLRTRTRYDEDGSFVLTVRGPAEFLPVVRAGLDAQRAALQRERDAAAVRRPQPDPEPVHEPVPDPAPETGPPPQPAPADEGGQAPGWPSGTSSAQAREAVDHLAAFLRGLSADAAALDAGAPGQDTGARVSAETPATPVGTSAATRAEPATPPDSDPRPEPGTAAPAVTDAEALVALAQAALDRESTAPDAARRRRWQLTAQVDPLTGWARQADGELLPPSSLRQVLRALPGRGGLLRLRRVTGADLRAHDLGRTRREVGDGLRELLGALDGERCRFPGCTRTRRLHAHHVVWWSRGGPTDLANLVLVCARHHTLVHAQGYDLVLHPDRRLEVRTADGAPVVHHPPLPDVHLGPAAVAPGIPVLTAATLPPDHVDARLDLRYAVHVLLAQAA